MGDVGTLRVDFMGWGDAIKRSNMSDAHVPRSMHRPAAAAAAAGRCIYNLAPHLAQLITRLNTQHRTWGMMPL
jgi:hypothetical protein